MYHAIVFLPLVGFLIVGLFGRSSGARPSEIITTGAALRGGRLSVGGLHQVGFGKGATRVQVAQWMSVGRPPGRLGVPDRYADRRDARGGQHGLGARAPLFHRLHARGSAPAAVLRLSVALHLRHADAGDGRQPRPDVLRLGGRGPRELSAHRLLVPEGFRQRGGHQGLHRQPRRRFRLSCSASSLVFVLFNSVAFDQIFPRVGELATAASRSSASSGMP